MLEFRGVQNLLSMELRFLAVPGYSKSGYVFYTGTDSPFALPLATAPNAKYGDTSFKAS
jgi:hypothetical protein